MRIISIICLLLSINGYSQEELRSESKIDGVTVFLSGAQVFRTANVNLKKGDNEIRFVGLSEFISPNSIQVIGQNSFKIVSVNHERNALQVKEDKPEIAKLVDKRKELEEDLGDKISEAEILLAEKKMILENNQIAGEESGVDMLELLDIADYYRNRLNAIDDQLLTIERDGKEIKKEYQDVVNQLSELGYNQPKATGEIVVKISADRTASTRIEFSYIVSNAGWEPLYDVRSDDITGPVELTYRGNVFQSTGIEWDKVQLTLSTGNPSISGTKPEFYKWTLANQNYERESDKRKLAMKAYESAPIGTGEGSGNGASAADYTTVSESAVSTEFKINLPYTIPSDGKRLSVEIQKYSLPVLYEYKAVPRLDPDAFLIARVSGWDEYYLLSGSANIYYQGTFVGTSYINTQTTQDTLTISLGRDNNVVVNRERVNDFGGTSFIGSNRKTEIGMRISIKNTKNTTMTIEVEEYIPTSTTKEIEVTLDESAGATYDEDSGQLLWTLILGPGESRKLDYGYTVKSPKNMILKNI